ncbi:MAG: DNA translocase FtsK, partial [Desulfovibrio sp.]|nr:DNA translocase FtsK [Desulfovibrio sp.]
GMVGSTMLAKSTRYLSPAGSFLLWLFIFLAGLQLTCNFSWLNLTREASNRIRPWLAKIPMPKKPAFLPESWKQKITVRLPAIKIPKSGWLTARMANIKTRASSLFETLKTRFPGKTAVPDLSPGPLDSFEFSAPAGPDTTEYPDGEKIVLSSPQQESALEETIGDASPETSSRITETVKVVPPSKQAPAAADAPKTLAPVPLPSPDLLNPPVPKKAGSTAALEEKGRALMACFNDFDVKGELVKITPGPVVTMYEVRPAPGVRVNKIAGLADDLCLALKAISVRIQAPLPGTDRVAIELPNDERQTVNFRELVETDAFGKGCGPLTMILGRDIAGNPYMADLASMPHMLVAGSTGAGKSVCLNSIIASFLYRLQPEQMRLMLIDPKRIEMSVYADLPHLVHPIVTEMSDAKAALDWAVHEMTRRYEIMKPLGVRNIAGYNKKIEAMRGAPLPEYADAAPLPYLVIIIDELAELIMVAAREVETSIARLGQLARAAGIHLILATQRPSVDIVTPIIKTNMSARVSFKVTSVHDSKTIIGQNGAEQLLGKGDMLFQPPTSVMKRLHGPFLSDDEVAKIADYWRERRAPDYQMNLSQWSAEKGSVSDGGDASDDPIYEAAKAYVIEQGVASISRLQRQFQIGFGRAGRLVDQFERDGIVGPASGSKPRKVINN